MIEILTVALMVVVLLATVLGSVIYQSSAASNTGTSTLSFPTVATPNVTPFVSSITVSQAGATLGPNAKLTVWDGPVGTGTVIWAAFLGGPGAGGNLPSVGSVGIIQEMPLPLTPDGKTRGLQATTGNQMNIQVIGTGNNQVIINARFSDGLPT